MNCPLPVFAHERAIIGQRLAPESVVPGRNAAFVRGLFGDTKIPRSQTKVRQDVLAWTKNPVTIPCAVYCFGLDNARFLRSLGYDPVVLHRTGVVNFRGALRRRRSAINNWGVNLFRHKLVIWQAALQDYDEIVWLDWDCRPLRTLPTDFWQTVTSRAAEMQATIRCYRRPKCPWRRGTNRHWIPSAAWVYLRGRTIADRLLFCHDLMPRQTEEVAMAAASDLLYGGWRGPQHWVDVGQEPYCVLIRGQHRPPLVPLFRPS